MNTTGDRIRNMRTVRGMTQKALASQIGIREATLSRYENDQRNGQWEILTKIADMLETNTDYLLGRTDNPTPIRVLESSINLTTDTLELIRAYQVLSEQQQSLVLERAQAYYDLEKS